MIHAPNVRLQMRAQFVIRPTAAGCRACGRGHRPVHGLPEALRCAVARRGMAVRLRYAVGGRTRTRMSSPCVQRQSHSVHGAAGHVVREPPALLFAHAIGATDGKLQSRFRSRLHRDVPSGRSRWVAHRERVCSSSRGVHRSCQRLCTDQAAAQLSRTPARTTTRCCPRAGERQAQAQRDATRGRRAVPRAARMTTFPRISAGRSG